MSDNLFYSRNIGLSNGNPVKIYGGTRITGRLGKWDMGFINMLNAEKDENPGKNFGVLRMRRQVINQNSYVGGIMTTLMEMNGKWRFNTLLAFSDLNDNYLTKRIVVPFIFLKY